MSFFSKMQNALANWMQGRNGPDNLGFTALIAAIVFSLLSLFRLPLASFLSMLCYVYALWRMLSRNVAKRQEENRQFMDKTGHAQTEIRQFFLRLRGIKTYKYFRCPQCKTRLRLKRGCGEKHITCPNASTSSTKGRKQCSAMSDPVWNRSMRRRKSAIGHGTADYANRWATATAFAAA